MHDEDTSLDYICDLLWFVGSPKTVAGRIRGFQEQVGGFGHLMIVSYNWRDEREVWTRVLRLLTRETLPLCQTAERVHMFAGASR